MLLKLHSTKANNIIISLQTSDLYDSELNVNKSFLKKCDAYTSNPSKILVNCRFSKYGYTNYPCRRCLPLLHKLMVGIVILKSLTPTVLLGQ